MKTIAYIRVSTVKEEETDLIYEGIETHPRIRSNWLIGGFIVGVCAVLTEGWPVGFRSILGYREVIVKLSIKYSVAVRISQPCSHATV